MSHDEDSVLADDGSPVRFGRRRVTGSGLGPRVMTWKQVATVITFTVGTLGGLFVWTAKAFVRQEVQYEIAKHLADPYAHGEIVRTLAVKQEITNRLDKLGDDVSSVKASVARIEGRLDGRESRGR